MTHSPCSPKVTGAEEQPCLLLFPFLSPSLSFSCDSPSKVSSESRNLRAGRMSKEYVWDLSANFRDGKPEAQKTQVPCPGHTHQMDMKSKPESGSLAIERALGSTLTTERVAWTQHWACLSRA